MQEPIVQQPLNTPAGMMIVSGRPTSMMNPVDSVITCLQKYVGFEGRASRSEYWWFALAIFIAGLLAVIIDVILFGLENDDQIGYVSLSFQLAVLLPSLAVSVRRLHDIGKSGWYILIAFIPIAGAIILLVWYCTDGEPVANVYGPVPTNTQNGNLDSTYVIVQQPMQQQYQQPVQQQNQEPPSGL